MSTDTHDMVSNLGRFSRHAEDSYYLPAAWYTDPAIIEIEKRRIFHRTWQYGAHVSELPSPGSYTVVELAEQSVLLVRGEDCQDLIEIPGAFPILSTIPPIPRV